MERESAAARSVVHDKTREATTIRRVFYPFARSQINLCFFAPVRCSLAVCIAAEPRHAAPFRFCSRRCHRARADDRYYAWEDTRTRLRSTLYLWQTATSAQVTPVVVVGLVGRSGPKFRGSDGNVVRTG